MGKLKLRRAAIEDARNRFNGKPLSVFVNDPTHGVLVNLGDVKPRRVEWLWPGRIPLGKITMLVGDGGVGKSTLTADLIARVTRGDEWPDGGRAERGGVVLCSAEDDPADTIRPRIDAAGGDARRVTLLTATRAKDMVRCVTLEDLPAMAEAVDRTPDCRLLILDPVSAFLFGDKDEHKNGDVRGMLAPVSKLAEAKRLAIVCVHHLNKSNTQSALHRIVGSIAWGTASRAAWGVTIDPEDEAPNPADRRRLLVPLKMNCGKPAKTAAYVIEEAANGCGRLVWDAEGSDLDADQAFAQTTRQKRATPARDEARSFLLRLLADGPVEVATVRSLAEGEGIAWATIKRVKGEVGIVASKDGFEGGFRWYMPGSEILSGGDDEAD